MNSKLTVAFIIACTSYQHSYTMEQQTAKKMSQETHDALLAQGDLPPEAYQPSGLTLEQDAAICEAFNEKVRKFNGTLNVDTDFKALEQAATDALIATMQYLKNPALDPNTAQDQDAKNLIMLRRLDPAPILNMVKLTSTRIHAAFLQTPEGLQKIAEEKKNEEERAFRKQLLIKRAALLGAGTLCAAVLFHNSFR